VIYSTYEKKYIYPMLKQSYLSCRMKFEDLTNNGMIIDFMQSSWWLKE